VLATPVTIRHQTRTGARPVNLSRDSHQVLLLLDRVFGPLTDVHGRRVMTERVSLSYASPFRVRLSMLTQGFVPGFVWEEEGNIVGTLSLIDAEHPGRYLIANVAVHPDLRRRGIGRALLQEALDHLERLHGREVMLQVENRNEGAIRLYEQHGFKALGLVNHWQVNASRMRQLDPGPEPVEIRQLRGADWRQAYRLDLAGLKPELNWPRPPSPDKYRRDIWRSLADLLNGDRSETWVAYPVNVSPGSRLLPGLVHVTSAWSRPHYVELRVDPAFRGRLERPLLSRALRRLQSQRRAVIRHYHPADDALTVELMDEANFELTRTLCVMRRTMGNQL
jgi:ribosomal protein S18 acetylase RimI-like enzyme